MEAQKLEFRRFPVWFQQIPKTIIRSEGRPHISNEKQVSYASRHLANPSPPLLIRDKKSEAQND